MEWIYKSRVFPSNIGPLAQTGELRPYGQPGPLPICNESCVIDWVKSSNFISWLECENSQTCETVNKSSKSIIAI